MKKAAKKKAAKKHLLRNIAKARAALAEKRRREREGTLLERAKLHHHRRMNHGPNVGAQEVELAMAYARGEVTPTQVRHALGLKVPPYTWLARVMAHILRDES